MNNYMYEEVMARFMGVWMEERIKEWMEMGTFEYGVVACGKYMV